MSDPMQNLNDAADALNQVAARAAGFYDDADARIEAYRSGYDELTASLKGVVNSQMRQTLCVSPDGNDGDDGLTVATAKATLEGVRAATPDGCTVEVVILGTEASPFVVGGVDFGQRNITLKGTGPGGAAYIKWRGGVRLFGGTLSTNYSLIIDYDGNEYAGEMFLCDASALNLGGYYGVSIIIKNMPNFAITRSDYNLGSLSSVYLGRVNLLDEQGDAYAGVAQPCAFLGGAGMVAYELWQCSMGPNFTHSGLQVATNKYIKG